MNHLKLFVVVVAVIGGARLQAQESAGMDMDLKKKYSFKVGSELGTESYKIASASGGLNQFIPKTGATSYLFELTQNLDEYRNIYSYEMLDAKHNSPTGYTPGNVAERTQNFVWEQQRFFYADSPGFMRHVYYGFGLGLFDRKTDTTYAGGLMPSSTRLGFRFTMGYENSINSAWDYTVVGNTFMPFYNREYSFQTGDFNYSLGLNLKVNFIYHVSELIDFSVGFAQYYEHTTFNGSGNRGTVNAIENFNIMSVPIEIRFQF